MIARVLVGLAALALLAGCATRIERADVRQLSSPTTQRLACPLRLAEVVDARPVKEAGLMGTYAYSFSDLPASLRQALQELGWSTAADARSVTVSVKKLYVGTNRATRTGVAALEVQPQGRPAFTVRGQAAAMNWTGSQASGVDILQDAVANARSELALQLNASCGS